MTATLWINISLAALAVGLWAGIPLWLVFKHPDKRPETSSRTAQPAYYTDTAHRSSAVPSAQRPDRERELVGADSR